MNNIILSESNKELPKKQEALAEAPKSISNIFQGRAETEISKSKFPDWDILPPNQFINPRIKPQ